MRLRAIVFRWAPASTTPSPKLREPRGAPASSLSATRLPTTAMSCWGASRSLRCELSATPTRLRCQTDRMIETLPLAFVASKPTMLCSATLSVTTASQGEHCPM